MMTALCIPASAITADFDGAEQALFGKPTSVEQVTVIPSKDMTNINRSKDSAFIPPGFGSPSADTPGTGSLLTPNRSGVAPMQIGSDPYTWNGSSSSNALLPTGGTTSAVFMPPSVNSGSSAASVTTTSFTPVTGMIRDDGSIGTLKIPAINVNVKVYDGESTANMKKGAAHFSETSCWDGNVAMAAHNRSSYFGKIHKLENGDTMTYTTKLGTRTYEVRSVYKIRETDTSCLKESSENLLTLITCVQDQPEYRWCVIAKQIS